MRNDGVSLLGIPAGSESNRTSSNHPKSEGGFAPSDSEKESWPATAPKPPTASPRRRAMRKIGPVEPRMRVRWVITMLSLTMMIDIIGAISLAYAAGDQEPRPIYLLLGLAAFTSSLVDRNRSCFTVGFLKDFVWCFGHTKGWQRSFQPLMKARILIIRPRTQGKVPR
jgi:hypothetical protein